jgi:hypothetical protein
MDHEIRKAHISWTFTHFHTPVDPNAERERFELSVPLGTSAFKAGAFGRSATVPPSTLGGPAVFM